MLRIEWTDRVAAEDPVVERKKDGPQGRGGRIGETRGCQSPYAMSRDVLRDRHVDVGIVQRVDQNVIGAS